MVRLQHYEREVRRSMEACRCSACDSVIGAGSPFARIRVNLWGRLWRTLCCCENCCRTAHTGVRPFNGTSFGRCGGGEASTR
jgi:hypothetical protein